MAFLFCPGISSNVSLHLEYSLAIDDEEATLSSNEAAKVGAKALTYEEAKGMDVDIPNAKEEDDGNDKIPETQDDLVSLPNLDIAKAKVEEPKYQSSPSILVTC